MKNSMILLVAVALFASVQTVQAQYYNWQLQQLNNNTGMIANQLQQMNWNAQQQRNQQMWNNFHQQQQIQAARQQENFRQLGAALGQAMANDRANRQQRRYERQQRDMERQLNERYEKILAKLKTSPPNTKLSPSKDFINGTWYSSTGTMFVISQSESAIGGDVINSLGQHTTLSGKWIEPGRQFFYTTMVDDNRLAMTCEIDNKLNAVIVKIGDSRAIWTREPMVVDDIVNQSSGTIQSQKKHSEETPSNQRSNGRGFKKKWD